MNFKGLDRIHDMLEKHPSGIDRLYTNGLINSLDMEYLLQRSRQSEIINGKLLVWERQISKEGGFEIHNTTELGRKLVLINEAIDAIERASLAFDTFERGLFIELSGLQDLVGSRYKARNAILAKDMPGVGSGVTDLEIERARAVRLDSIITGLPRSKKMTCPVHKEKTASFHVAVWGYCFGCGYHCDSIGWICAFENLGFLAAVKKLNRLID